MAVTKQGKVYTWGYSGYGVLGRLGIENIPVQVGTGFKDGNNNYRVKLPKNQPFIPLEELG
jgi:alpha-tubulin suppressor-like RCC1 family protein